MDNSSLYVTNRNAEFRIAVLSDYLCWMIIIGKMGSYFTGELNIISIFPNSIIIYYRYIQESGTFHPHNYSI